jgi:hypothetical protein
MRSHPRFVARIAALVCLTLAMASLASSAFGEVVPGGSADKRWGLSLNLGTGTITGDLNPPLQDPVAGEFGIFQMRGPWRFGAAINFASFLMEPPYQHEQEWGYMRGALYAGRVFNHTGRLRPYLQARVGVSRLHPRSALFDMDPLPDDFVVGDSPTKPSNGFFAALVPGVEFKAGRAFAIDVSGMVSPFSVDDYDLSPVGLPNAGSGTTTEWRLGMTWWPHGETLGEASDRPLDAWSLKPSYGWTAAEVLAINLGASYFNEYVRNANFNQISPRSWKANLEGGFHYDDNEFRTNQYIHPFNGSTYYNSGRTNGLDFWSSSVAAVGGAFVWEAFGETHPMSYNDMISTGIGGIALGEAMYRLSSLVLDNEATGSGRTWREIGAFAIDPVRGFNRFLSGRGGEVHPNPTDPMDHRPPNQENWFAAGVRLIGEGESFSENLDSHAYFQIVHSQGSVFTNSRRGPFDYFDIDAQFNFGEKVPLGKAMIRGNLWTKPLGESQSDPRHVLAIVQHFEYLNTTAYEWGGQSFGPSLYSRFGNPGGIQYRTRVDLIGTLLGAVNSDYSFLAEVENRERFREYDYGPGLGTALYAAMVLPNRAIIDAAYRLQWIDVRNGSVYNTDDFDGSEATHVIQAAQIRAIYPIRKATSIGADVGVFLRQSDYSLPVVSDIRQRNPQMRAYLVWSPVD